MNENKATLTNNVLKMVELTNELAHITVAVDLDKVSDQDRKMCALKMLTISLLMEMTNLDNRDEETLEFLILAMEDAIEFSKSLIIEINEEKH